MAYADMYDLMDLTESLVSGLVQHVTGGLKVSYQPSGPDGETLELDFTTPWKRFDMIEELEAKTGVKFPPGEELHTDETNKFLRDLCTKNNVDCGEPRTNARLLDKLVGEFIENQCLNPSFIVGHPQMMSPLAKVHRSRPGLCERFEAFVATREICNAYTELNDPFIQKANFEEQMRQKDLGDDEAQGYDDTFVSHLPCLIVEAHADGCTLSRLMRASESGYESDELRTDLAPFRSLEHGLPPTGGWGLGIDRLVMMLTNSVRIDHDLPCPFKFTHCPSISSQRPTSRSGRPRTPSGRVLTPSFTDRRSCCFPR